MLSKICVTEIAYWFVKFQRFYANRRLIAKSKTDLDLKYHTLLLALLAVNRFHGPVAEPFVVFEYLHWNLVVTLERLPRVGAEGFHFALAIFANRRFINLKIQLSLVKNAEESLVPIQPVAAKHPPRLDSVQLPQLI